MLDNLSSHISKTFKSYMSKYGIKIIYTSANTPQFNPIELCFKSIKKKVYTKAFTDELIIQFFFIFNSNNNFTDLNY